MSNNREELDLLWEGRRSVEQAAVALGAGQTVVLQLPADYNHALFERLHPHAAPGVTETVDAHGGAELLKEVAMLAGLAPLAQLAEAARAAGAQVSVRSPSIISIHPSAPAPR